MKHQDSRTPSFQFQQPGNPVFFWKTKAATLMRAFMLILLGAVLLPAIGSAQTAEDLQKWRDSLKQTLPAQPGCYKAIYTSPNPGWLPDSTGSGCPRSNDTSKYALAIPAPAELGDKGALKSIGSNGDVHGPQYVATAVGGPISSVEAYFVNASASTAISSTNIRYSLQLNTNMFRNNDVCGTATCEGGVIQFTYSNVSGLWFVYFIMSPDRPCPYDMTMNSGGHCQINAATYFAAGRKFNPGMRLYGTTNGNLDTVILFDGTEAFAATVQTPSAFKKFPAFWQDAEFNVMGDVHLPQAQFVDGSEMTVKVEVNNGTQNTPTCKLSTGFDTGEGNNLNYNSPCCAVGGAKPYIAFKQSSTEGKTTSCASLGGGTPWYTITPAVSDPDKVIAYPTGSPPPLERNENWPFLAESGKPASITFQFKPGYAGLYNINTPVGGTCGGALSGSDYTTNPINGDCTVTASVSPVTYTISTSVGAGGAISPTGPKVVTSGTKQPFTVTPNPGYAIASVSGCGGTLSGNTFTTGAITGNCIVSATFTPGYTVTATILSSFGTVINSATKPASPGQIIPLTLAKPVALAGGTCGGALDDSHTVFTTKPITADCTVVFYMSPPTVTSSAGTGGMISPSGSVSVVPGTTQSFTVMPNSGYKVASVSGCGGTWNGGNSYTTGPVTANCTVSATFAYVTTYTVTATILNSTGTVIINSATKPASPGQIIPLTLAKPVALAGGTCGGTLDDSHTVFTTKPIIADCTVVFYM